MRVASRYARRVAALTLLSGLAASSVSSARAAVALQTPTTSTVMPTPAPSPQQKSEASGTERRGADMRGMGMQGAAQANAAQGGTSPTNPDGTFKTAPTTTTQSPPPAGARTPASGSRNQSESSTDSGMKNLQNDSDETGGMGIRPDFPSPINDRRHFTYVLFDNLEFQTGDSPAALRYDFLTWHGGDRNRLWLKSEGRQNVRNREGGVEFQALYGRMISAYFDFQAGLRVDAVRGGSAGDARSRVFAVVGLQGLSPFRFDVEPVLFIDHNGNFEARFTGTYEFLLTQRLILQPRLETNFAFQDVPRFDVGKGLSDIETGLRLRYEFSREFAPYIGYSYSQSFGGTADYARRAGERVRSSSFVTGIRFWF